ncbi:MAG TPA: 7TM diverse intracellular signaling domain-containing protein [Cytophagaceae bacterium]|nr:7TM diverse intracellular signaling domain-containing protein [Cytophagaceae bacterium]
MSQPFQYCLSFFLLLNSCIIKAQSITELSDREEYFLKNYTVLEDKNKDYTINEVSSPAFLTKFSTPNETIESNHFITSAYWLRFTINDVSGKDIDWLLEAYDFKIDRLDLFVPDNKGHYSKKSLGDAFPFSSKFFQHKNLVFNLPLPKNTSTTFYIRIEAREHIFFTFLLRSYPILLNYALQEYWFFGIFYGIVFLIVVLNLFLSATLKDRIPLFYAWYVLSIGIYSMASNGIGFQFLWPEYPSINKYASSVTALSLVISALLFCKNFLLQNIKATIVQAIIYIAIVVRIGIFIFQVVSHSIDLGNPLLDWLTLFVAYMVGIYCWIKGFKPSRFYVIGFSFVFIGFLITALLNAGIIISNSIFVVYSLNFATLLEILFLSLALADRIQIFKKEKEKEQLEKINQLEANELLKATIISQLKENEVLKDKTNQELEEKVRERTLELEAANNEIRRINEALQEDNVKLVTNVKDLSKARVMQKVVSFEEFQRIYTDEYACLEYLANLKWAKGYKCDKCENTNYSKGPVAFSRRCSKCSYIESATANTIFYRLKFPIIKAFYMVFLVSNRNEITADELSEKLSLRRQTCWAFKRKILDTISIKKRPRSETDGWSYLVLGNIEDKVLKKTQKESEE